jgi:hypothetical protein
MHDDPKQRHEQHRPHDSPIATTRQRSRNQTCEPSGPRPGPRGWALVEVWNGAVLATFTEEAPAREAMSTADSDEVVILHVRT